MIRIEPVNIAHAAALSKIASHIFLETFLPHNPAQAVHDYVNEFMSPTAIAATLTDKLFTTLGVFSDEKLIGYIQVVINKDEIHEGTELELKRFYLEQGHHGQGIAQQMMESVYQIARQKGYSKFWLGVWEHNLRAKKFYSKCGFRKVAAHAFDLGGDIQTDDIYLKELE